MGQLSYLSVKEHNFIKAYHNEAVDSHVDVFDEGRNIFFTNDKAEMF